MADAGFIASRNAAVKSARGIGFTVGVESLNELQRAFKRLDKEAQKELASALRKDVDKVAVTGGARAPRLSGALQQSIRPFVSGLRASVGSTLPYAALEEFGGSTGVGHRPGVPWSGSVIVKPHLFLSRAVDDHADEFVHDFADAVERAAINAGWRGA